MRKGLKKFFVFVALCFALLAQLQAISLSELYIVAADGTYLGSFENEYSSRSVYNQYGNYGSPYSAKSIMNPYSNYGSDYSNLSPFNEYSNNAPWISDKYGNTYGRLSVNRYASGVTKQSYQLALELKALRDSY